MLTTMAGTAEKRYYTSTIDCTIGNSVTLMPVYVGRQVIFIPVSGDYSALADYVMASTNARVLAFMHEDADGTTSWSAALGVSGELSIGWNARSLCECVDNILDILSQNDTVMSRFTFDFERLRQIVGDRMLVHGF